MLLLYYKKPTAGRSDCMLEVALKKKNNKKKKLTSILNQEAVTSTIIA